MDPLTEGEIRASFVNCSKGDTKRVNVPRDLAERPWDDLDFLGWADPVLAGRAYIVVPGDIPVSAAQGPVGVALRYESGGPRKAQMCTICLTTHTGSDVSLMTAAKIGESGRRGNTVGTYMCTDLACSLYARNKKRPALGNRYREELSVEAKAERVRENLAAFLLRITG